METACSVTIDRIPHGDSIQCNHRNHIHHRDSMQCRKEHNDFHSDSTQLYRDDKKIPKRHQTILQRHQTFQRNMKQLHRDNKKKEPQRQPAIPQKHQKIQTSKKSFDWGIMPSDKFRLVNRLQIRIQTITVSPNVIFFGVPGIALCITWTTSWRPCRPAFFLSRYTVCEGHLEVAFIREWVILLSYEYTLTLYIKGFSASQKSWRWGCKGPLPTLPCVIFKCRTSVEIYLGYRPYVPWDALCWWRIRSLEGYKMRSTWPSMANNGEHRTFIWLEQTKTTQRVSWIPRLM